jgi:hypothetical protein
VNIFPRKEEGFYTYSLKVENELGLIKGVRWFVPFLRSRPKNPPFLHLMIHLYS